MIYVHEKEDCSGCYACASICPKNCIDMIQDNEGFWYPTVEMKLCVNCHLCEEVCPVLHPFQSDNTLAAYAAYNKNEAIRRNSSSGGIFTMIAEYIISNGGVVFGAQFDNNFNVVHSYVETIDDLEKFRGSKYVQSKIGNTYYQAKQFLIQSRQVLFTGTPCQIGGLKSYLGKELGRKLDNLITQDIICHGVPSPKIWQKYIYYQEKYAGAKVQRISFRRKDEGWKKFSVSFLFNNNTEYLKNLTEDFFMQVFLQNICLRPSCYSCRFKTISRNSDFTLADFWGVERILEGYNDNKGTSLVLTHTKKAENILIQLKENMMISSIDTKKALALNPSMSESVEVNYNAREKLDHISG